MLIFNPRLRDFLGEVNEAERLLKELPSHLSDMAAFTLLTGLRKSNVTGLKWKNVDLVKRHTFVPASQSKTNKAIPVPLSTEAIAIIRKQIGKHIEFVFSYQGKAIKQCATAAWYKALKRAEIEDFHCMTYATLGHPGTYKMELPCMSCKDLVVGLLMELYNVTHI